MLAGGRKRRLPRGNAHGGGEAPCTRVRVARAGRARRNALACTHRNVEEELSREQAEDAVADELEAGGVRGRAAAELAARAS